MKRCMACMKEYEEEYELCPHCGYAEGEGAASEYHLPPGSILAGKYQVGRVLGFGGFGITYIGWDLLLERKIAIKEYLPSQYATRTREDTTLTVYSGEKEQKFLAGMEKFSDEAKRLAKFQGIDGIVEIYDTFLENKTAYIVMEYLEGETVKERLEREGRIPVEEAIDLIIPVLESLEKVHQEGILHRDIAPDNIFLCQDENGVTKAKLLDFGAARFATSHHSKSLSVLVKSGYSPYEQYRSNGEQDAWTDVYAVAATLYHMITGEKPQDAMERYVAREMHKKDKVKPIRKMGVKIRKSTEAAIMNAMNITYEYRTHDATTFLEELRAEQVKRKHERIVATDIGSWPRWLKATTSTAAAVVAVYIGLVAGGVLPMPAFVQAQDSSVPKGMTRVPNLLKLSQDKAKNKAEKSELIFQISDSTYSDTIPEGRVYAQDMLAGSIVEGKNEETGNFQTPIFVSMSLGVEKTYVPDVVHFMETAAAEMIYESKLTYTVTQEQGDDAPGSVISQSLAVNEQVEVGTELQLVVSTGMGFDPTVETTVPDVTNMKYDDGKALALESSLYLAKQEVVYDQNIPENQIIEQSPAAGTPMNQDGTILVKVSAGAGIAHVPNVTSKQLEEAMGLLEKEGLKVKIEHEDSDVVAKDCVIRQSPEPDQEVERGSTVIIYISNGNDLVAPDVIPSKPAVTEEVQEAADEAAENQPDVMPQPTPTPQPDTPKEPEDSKKPDTPKEPEDTTVAVPNVSGKTQAEAESELASAGFSCSVVEAYSSTVEQGRVIGQSVAAGTKMAPGTLIVLTVSKGPETVAVPNVVGKSRADAESALSAAGLNYSVAEEFNSSVADGMVARQSAAANSQVKPGSSVLITVSKGPKAPDGWTPDGSFVNNPHYTCEQKTQYRSKSYKTLEGTSQPGTPSGYSYVKGEKNGYTDWSAWSGYDYRDNVNDTYTQSEAGNSYWYYYRFVCDCGYYCCWGDNTWPCPKCKKMCNNLETMYSPTKPSGTPHSYPTESGLEIFPGDEWWWYPQNNYQYTEYRRRTRQDKYLYWYIQNNWGNWQDTVIQKSNMNEVETRTLYKYTAK